MGQRRWRDLCISGASSPPITDGRERDDVWDARSIRSTTTKCMAAPGAAPAADPNPNPDPTSNYQPQPQPESGGTSRCMHCRPMMTCTLDTRAPSPPPSTTAGPSTRHRNPFTPAAAPSARASGPGAPSALTSVPRRSRWCRRRQTLPTSWAGAAATSAVRKAPAPPRCPLAAARRPCRRLAAAAIR